MGASFEIINTDLSTLASLSQEELKDFLKNEFKGAAKQDKAKSAEFLKEIESEIKAAKEKLQLAKKELREIEREGNSGFGNRKDPAVEGEMDDLNELLDALTMVKSEARAVSTQVGQEIAKHNFDLKTGEDVNLSPLDLDGETYTYELGGGALSASAETEAKVKKVVNDKGEVIQDANGDGALNYADVEHASQADPLKGQKIFINTTNQSWSLASANPATGEYTFKVTEGENHSFVKFTGAKEVSFFFNNLNMPGEESLKGWPTALLEKSFRGEDPVSLQEQIFPSAKQSTERLKAIPGYQNAIREEGFNATASQFGIKSVDYNLFKKAVDEIYAAKDDPTKSREEILSKIVGMGGKDLIHALILGIGANSDDKAQANLAELFGPSIIGIENALGDPKNYSANDKLTVMLLETQADAAGKFGGKEFFEVALASGSSKPYIPGLIVDKENPAEVQSWIDAVKKYEEATAVMGLSPSGDEKATIEKLSSFLPTPPAEIKKSMMDRLKQIKIHPQGTESVDSEEWQDFIDLLSKNLFKADGSIRDDAWPVILNAMNGEGSTPFDETVGMGGAIGAAGAGIGLGVGIGIEAASTLAFFGGAGAAMGSAVPILGTVIGAVGGAIVGVVASLFGNTEQDELLSNMIVVFDQILPFEFKKQLFPLIATEASDWLLDDSDDLWESDATNQTFALDILTRYSGDLDDVEASQVAPAKPDQGATQAA